MIISEAISRKRSLFFVSCASRTDAGYSGPIFYGPERIDVETRKKRFFFGACQLVPIAVRLVSDVQKKKV